MRVCNRGTNQPNELSQVPVSLRARSRIQPTTDVAAAKMRVSYICHSIRDSLSHGRCCSSANRVLEMLMASSTRPKLFTLILLSSLSVVSLNMFLPSISAIAGEFHAGYGLLANVSIAGYAGMTTVLQLLIGPLSDRVRPAAGHPG